MDNSLFSQSLQKFRCVRCVKCVTPVIAGFWLHTFLNSRGVEVCRVGFAILLPQSVFLSSLHTLHTSIFQRCVAGARAISGLHTLHTLHTFKKDSSCSLRGVEYER